MRFLLDQSLSARVAGDVEVACAFVRAAEALVRSAFPDIAVDLALAASRKGRGNEIGSRLAQHLDAASAACVALVLTLRGSRRPVVDSLRDAFRNEPMFEATMRLLCRRVFEPESAATHMLHVMPVPGSIEVGAPRWR
jgi:hypothetical protein